MENKQSKLQRSEYILLLEGFRDWMQLLNYSAVSIPALVRGVEGFVKWLEQNNKLTLEQLSATDGSSYITGLKEQQGQRTGKIFSGSHINKQIQALKLFSRYLRETRRSNTGFVLQRMEQKPNKPCWLTTEEMQRLYDEIPNGLLGIRDKAMLAVFYGCGLRLNEGASVELKDIDYSRKVLHVRKGKHYKERFVPIADKNFEELRLYIDYARPQLLQQLKTDRLFIGANQGRSMHKQSLYIRIKKLVRRAGIKKKVGTHSLRHSIATHLLQSGMKLERIQQFLGHSSIDSTQIYTHLINEAP
jgi:site-specific recombinase XerD